MKCRLAKVEIAQEQLHPFEGKTLTQVLLGGGGIYLFELHDLKKIEIQSLAPKIFWVLFGFPFQYEQTDSMIRVLLAM